MLKQGTGGTSASEPKGARRWRGLDREPTISDARYQVQGER